MKISLLVKGLENVKKAISDNHTIDDIDVKSIKSYEVAGKHYLEIVTESYTGNKDNALIELEIEANA